MQILLRDFVNTIPNAKKHEIIQSFEQLEQNGGFIGESVIRTYTEEYFAKNNRRLDPFALTAHALVFECYRFFYNRTNSVLSAN